MGGVPCEIIIIGNQLLGDVAGIYESFSEAEPYLNPLEKEQIRDFLSSTKQETDFWLNAIRASGNIETDIISLGAQVVGNLSAVCDTATENGLTEERQKELLLLLDQNKKISDKWLKLMRERAEKDKD